MTWPLEHIAIAADLCDAGWRTHQIAAELNRRFGTAYTKNAVLGLGTRRGWAWEHGIEARRQRAAAEGRAIRRSAPRPVRRFRAPCDPPLAPPRPRSMLDPAEIPVPQRRQLLELRNTHCRFPYGDVGTPGFFFCGAAGADFAAGIAYCPAHCATAFAPPRR